MDFDILGNIGDFVGGIAVVVTLAYLAIQIRQDTIQSRVNIATNQWDAMLHAYDPIYDGENGIVFRKGLLNYESLDTHERLLFHGLMARIVGVCEISLYQKKHGALEPELFEKHSRVLEGIISSPGGTEYWRNAAPVYGEDLQAHIESMLANPSAFVIQMRLDP